MNEDITENNTPGDAGAELANRITAVLGEGWSKRLAGNTGVGLLDDGSVAITAGGLTFYLRDDELWAQTQRDGRTFIGNWNSGEFEVVSSAPAPEPDLN